MRCAAAGRGQVDVDADQFARAECRLQVFADESIAAADIEN